MKLYTLKYNCNSPVDQQINVQTNSDYKIGIKVVKDGESVNLKTSELSVGSLSADSEKFNGYITFNASSGDDERVKLYDIDVNKGYDVDGAISSSGQMPSVKGDFKAMLSVRAGDVGIANIEIPSEKFVNNYYTWKNASTPAPSDISAWTLVESSVIYSTAFPLVKSGDITTYIIDVLPSAPFPQVSPVDGTAITGPGLWFIDASVSTPTYHNLRQTLVLKDDDILMGKDIRFTANNYWAAAYVFQLGTPFETKFKLCVKTEKSSIGDIGSFSNDKTTTAKLTGEFVDGTSFDYNVVVI